MIVYSGPCLSPVILLEHNSGDWLSCVPHARPPNQKYNSLGAPSIPLRGHIAFNSILGEPTRGVSGLYGYQFIIVI